MNKILNEKEMLNPLKRMFYNEILKEWHNDYLKHKKWVQDFNNTKNSSYNDVARWHIAKDYELWIPDSIIDSCYGLNELKNKVNQLIKESESK